MQSSKGFSAWKLGSACTRATRAAVRGQRAASIAKRAKPALRKKLATETSAIERAPKKKPSAGAWLSR